MSRGKEAKLWAIRLTVYSGLALALWLRLRATNSVQAVVATIAFLSALLTVNFYCVRLIVGYVASPRAQPSKLVARSTSVFFLALGVLAIVLCDTESITAIVALIRRGAMRENALGYAWLSGFVGTLFAWVGAYEIRIMGDRVDYFSLFTGERSLHRRDIDHAIVRVGWFTDTDRFRPTNRLELLPRRDEGLQPIIINLKAFKKPDMDVLFDWLGEKVR